MRALPPTAASRHPRAGLSLLEVLVAGGILAVGLASVSALLPAASARLGQATEQDRAGVLAANARAECVNRGLVAADIFSSATTACVFGQLAGLSGPGIAGASAVLAQRTGTSTFQLAEDPAFRWGAMLTPTSGTAAAGLPATLSIAVFRKAPTISGTIPISQTGGTSSPLFQLTSGSIRVWQGSGWASINPNEAFRRQFFPACSHAVALTGTSPPRWVWVRVTSSWTMPGPITSGSENVNGRRSFVVLDPNPLTSGTTVSGTTVNVIGFDGLLRVDHHPVTLD